MRGAPTLIARRSPGNAWQDAVQLCRVTVLLRVRRGLQVRPQRGVAPLYMATVFCSAGQRPVGIYR
ncbi:hypothetical protein ASF01_01910 [Stenotrophomonas sp. Leaf70]|uniref:Uncharacterized protein n=1 Tax=Stenotrophomonas nitritireducens TaxID=83617 RepID=A0ABR5NKF4_9GAMM|nr:hypothetical protein ASF01_01910 [Stenotrophomonas sp. Leaf70]KRG57712.1 hypothetical protein ABB22_08510 [Stenotrophomonas nitritireducens]